MLTLNQIIKQLNNVADSHANINSFTYDEPYNFAASGDIRYPAMLVEQQPFEYAENTLTYVFNIYIMDLIHKDESDKKEVLSDTLLTCLDVVAMLDRTTDLKFLIDKNITFTDFVEPKFDGEPCGYYFNLRIKTQSPLDRCATPLKSTLNVVNQLNYDLTASSPQFIFKVDTTKAGSASNQFILPLATGTTNLSVDWGDGTTEVVTTSGNKTHTYSSSGIYMIKLYGEFVGLYFNDGGDKLKITSIEQWGSVVWKSLQNAFYGCSNLVANYTDSPTLSLTNTNISSGFRDCTLFNGNVDWLVNSSVTQVEYLLGNCVNFNQSVSTWNTSNVTNFTGLFFTCSTFNKPVPFDTTKATTMYAMFSNAIVFNQAVNFNTSLVTSMAFMFEDANKFNQSVASFNTSNVTDMRYMFRRCLVFNQSVSTFDVSNVTQMDYMFEQCSVFNQSLSGWNTSKVTNFFRFLTSATTYNQNLGILNISSATDMTNFAALAGLNSANVDSTLIGFAAQAPNIKNNVSLRLGSGTRTSASNAAVTTLTGAPYNWTITNP